MGWTLGWTDTEWTNSWATSFDPSDENIDPNAWTDESGNVMTDQSGAPIIFTP